MGFSWVGFKEGYDQVMAQKREDELRKEAKLETKVQSMIPLLIERRQRERAMAAEGAKYGRYLSNRLSGGNLDETTKSGFLNLATSSPSDAASIVEGIQKIETEKGIRLSPEQIVKSFRIFEQTRPEDVPMDEWIKQAAGKVTTTESGIDFEQTLTSLLSGEMDESELLNLQVDLMTPSGSGGGVGIIDVDTTNVFGIEPAKQAALRKGIVEEARAQFQKDLSDITSKLSAADKAGEEPSTEDNTRYEFLTRMSQSEDLDATLFNYYAPQIIPRLAEINPELSRLYPQYFGKPVTVNPTAEPTVSPEIKIDYSYQRDENNEFQVR